EGAAGRQVVAMLAREVAVDEPRPGAPPRSRTQLLAVAPVGAGDSGGAGLGGERLLGGEVVVEAAVGEAGLLHELGEPDAVDPPLAEQPPGGLHDGAAMSGRRIPADAHAISSSDSLMMVSIKSSTIDDDHHQKNTGGTLMSKLDGKVALVTGGST